MRFEFDVLCPTCQAVVAGTADGHLRPHAWVNGCECLTYTPAPTLSSQPMSEERKRKKRAEAEAFFRRNRRKTP